MIVLDTTVLSYAVGGEHPLRESARKVIEYAGAQPRRVTTTTEVIQEFAHAHSRRRGRAKSAGLARSFVDLLSPLLQIGPDDLELGLKLFEKHELLGGFDAVLAAVVINNEAEALVSGDTAFASVPKLRFVPLGDALGELLG